jgi:transporter family protein
MTTKMTSQSWAFWALLSAIFAALTAIFAKVGVEDIDSDLATLVRTAVVIVALSAFVWFAGKWTNPFELSSRSLTFLALSGLATGASWVCYFRALKLGDASKVAPVDKLSLVLVAVFAFAFLGERPTVRDWAGISMVAGGVLLLAFKR